MPTPLNLPTKPSGARIETTTLPKELPCLELRINSVEDARREVAHAGRTFKRVKAFNLAGVELVIAKEVESLVSPILAGAFGVKTYRSLIAPRGTNRFFTDDEDWASAGKVEDKRTFETKVFSPTPFVQKVASVSMTGISGATPPEAPMIQIADGISVQPRKKSPIKTERLSDTAAQTLFAQQPAAA